MNQLTELFGTRSTHRKRVKTWARIFPGNSPSFVSHVEDISAGGLRVADVRALNRDQLCTVVFMLPLEAGEEIIQVRCRVADVREYTPGQFYIGLQFIEWISDAATALRSISAYLVEGGTHGAE